MEIDKTKLVASIEAFLKVKRAELVKATAAQSKREDLITTAEKNRRAFAFKKLATSKHTQMRWYVRSTWGTKDVEITLTDTIPASEIPENILNDPEVPLATKPAAIELEIAKAEEQLNLISMAKRDVININTKAILDSIQPYLKYKS